jgi:hypothetical protein
VIIFAAVMAFFLLMEYVNTRKLQHLMWGFALILTFIAFHQVSDIVFGGSYLWLLTSWGTGFVILIPGLIAAGLLVSTFESKPLIGQIYLLCIVIIAVVTAIFGLENIIIALTGKDFAPFYPYAESGNFDPANRWWYLTDNWFRMSLTAGASLVSLGVMLVIPLYTTLKSKETSRKALLIIIAPILFIVWIIIFLFGMTFVETWLQGQNTLNWDSYVMSNAVLWFTFGLFPYFFMFGLAFLILGMLYTPKWKFAIPGVDLEQEARIEPVKVQETKPLISSVLGIAGGVLLVLGALLAGVMLPSDKLPIGITTGVLIGIGLLSAAIGLAVIIGWEAKIRGIKLTTYLRIGLGAAALILVALLMFMPMTVPTAPPFPPGATAPLPVFLMEEGLWWSYIGVIFLFAGPALILAGGILRQFVFKE